MFINSAKKPRRLHPQEYLATTNNMHTPKPCTVGQSLVQLISNTNLSHMIKLKINWQHIQENLQYLELNEFHTYQDTSQCLTIQLCFFGPHPPSPNCSTKQVEHI